MDESESDDRSERRRCRVVLSGGGVLTCELQIVGEEALALRAVISSTNQADKG